MCFETGSLSNKLNAADATYFYLSSLKSNSYISGFLAMIFLGILSKSIY